MYVHICKFVCAHVYLCICEVYVGVKYQLLMLFKVGCSYHGSSQSNLVMTEISNKHYFSRSMLSNGTHPFAILLIREKENIFGINLKFKHSVSYILLCLSTVSVIKLSMLRHFLNRFSKSYEPQYIYFILTYVFLFII